MNRYISGNVITNLNDITGDEVLILDAYSIFDGLDTIAQHRPIAAIADNKYIFSHISSFLQMINVPLFFAPSSIIEDLCHLKQISIDLLKNTTTSSIDAQKQLPDLGPSIMYKNEQISVCSSLKGMDINNSIKYGADGIGLISTEFVFYNRVFYNKDEKTAGDFQVKTFNRMFENYPSIDYTIRLFDIIDDKIPVWCKPIWAEYERKNRTSRLLFSTEFSEFFEQQIKAIVTLAKKFSVSLLIPYFTSCDEIKTVRKAISAYDSNCNVLLGVMIETVSAIGEMRSMIDMVDFFSVGSNDLVQSYFGLDRTNIEDQLDRISLNDAFWSTLRNIITNANGKQVRICGQLPIASNAINHLIELGYRNFTISPMYIPYLKNVIHEGVHHKI